MQRIILHKIICSFLICTLALSITPKIFLHALVANHKDVFAGYKNDSGKKIAKATFNCTIENCVAESPFIPVIEVAEHTPVKLYSLLKQFYKNNFYSSLPFSYSLRGPPFC